MPANLTPDYLAAEARFKQAKTPEDRIEALEEMLRTIPKHKGTEKMRADIKRRLSKTRGILEQKKKTGRKGPSLHPAREGCAQCVLVGPPNSGKSSILSNFTNAPAVVGDYPYTTVKPMPGMLRYENISFQLIDLPPISSEFMETWIPSLVRVAELVLPVVGLDDIAGLDIVIQRLKTAKIELVNHIDRALYHGSTVKLPALILANKTDHADASVSLEILQEEYPDFSILPLSTFNPVDAAKLGRSIYEFLDLIRVYTKAPGKEPNRDQPIVLRRGSVLLDAAEEIHKDFVQELKFARVWGAGKFDGQRVQRDYVLTEGDVIEFKV
ncbi:TGS domain-containing protein [bacterium]|nr:TGS domain-containing protein [candidate division CSSED10-310 bacterium]